MRTTPSNTFEHLEKLTTTCWFGPKFTCLWCLNSVVPPTLSVRMTSSHMPADLKFTFGKSTSDNRYRVQATADLPSTALVT